MECNQSITNEGFTSPNGGTVVTESKLDEQDSQSFKNNDCDLEHTTLKER